MHARARPSRPAAVEGVQLEAAHLHRLLAVPFRRSYPSRHVIFQPGEKATTLYYVQSGRLALYGTHDDGQELVLDYPGPGSFIGQVGMFMESHTRQSSLQTRGPAVLFEITYKRLKALLQDEMADIAVPLLFAFGRDTAMRLRSTSRSAMDLAFLEVEARVENALQALAAGRDSVAHSRGRVVRVSRAELGRLTGCSRESAGRAVAGLEAKGRLEAEGKSILVLDAPATAFSQQAG